MTLMKTRIIESLNDNGFFQVVNEFEKWDNVKVVNDG